MKNIQVILFCYIFLSFGLVNDPGNEIFFSELGKEKTESFNALVNSYENFLLQNYPKQNSINERTELFLLDIIKDERVFVFDSLSTKELIYELEESGLRKDIYLYSEENYSKHYEISTFLPQSNEPIIELVEIDDNFDEIPSVDIDGTSKNDDIESERTREYPHEIYFNKNGLFLYALTKSMQNDSTFLPYCEIKSMGIDISPMILANGYLNNINKHEYHLWYNKVPLIIDIYLHQLLVKHLNK